MNINEITIGEIVVGITAIGVICGFMYKIFSFFNQVKTNTKDIKECKDEIKNIKEDKEKQKNEIMTKVEETNSAVNLLCTAISALIDNEINADGNIEALKKIKTKLDEKKEIV